jgi:hypothetical protein
MIEIVNGSLHRISPQIRSSIAEIAQTAGILKMIGGKSFDG